MKILIFGGGYSFIEYYDFSTEYWKQAEVCAILDNDKKKWGKKIRGIIVVSPEHIYGYRYDVILICSVYEEEIREQLVHKFWIDDKQIETRRHFFDEVIFPWYKKRYGDKNILVVGEKYRFDTLYQAYCDFFKVIGFVALEEIARIDAYDYDYVLLTNYQDQKELEMIDKIVAMGYIEKERLLTHEVFLIFQNHIEQYSSGERYADKKFLIIRNISYVPGLGSICGMVMPNVTYARHNGYIPIVDLKSFKSQYLEEEEYGTVNAWEKFFFQPDKYILDDIKEAKYISRASCSIRWQPVCGEQVSSWIPKMKNELEEKYRKYLKNIEDKRVLGVLFRGTDYSQQKPFGLPVQPDLDTMINMTREKMEEWGEFDLIFLCTEVRQACDRFKAEFENKVIYYPQLRFDAETDVVRLALYSFNVQGERTRRGEDYWIALNILASCNSIIAGRCCGTDMALKINGNSYENVYLFDLGIYGAKGDSV